jgi:hypothetical protein
MNCPFAWHQAIEVAGYRQKFIQIIVNYGGKINFVADDPHQCNLRSIVLIISISSLPGDGDPNWSIRQWQIRRI